MVVAMAWMLLTGMLDQARVLALETRSVLSGLADWCYPSQQTARQDVIWLVLVADEPKEETERRLRWAK